MERLLKRYLAEHGEPFIDAEWIDWMINLMQKGEWVKATWRQSLAAVSALVDLDEPILERLQKASTDGVRSRGLRRRTKHISTRAKDRVARAMKGYCRTASPIPERLEMWLEAGEATGLRPAEWENAQLTAGKDDRWVLRVKNAKHSHGRGHGKYREIRIESEVTLAAVRHHLELIHDYISARPDREFRHYYNSCRAALKRINKNLPKKETKLCLYSTRHQFKNNARAAGLTYHEIANLMGHASTRTAQKHYGRTRAAGGRFDVRPNCEPENQIRGPMSDSRNDLNDNSMPEAEEASKPGLQRGDKGPTP